MKLHKLIEPSVLIIQKVKNKFDIRFFKNFITIGSSTIEITATDNSTDIPLPSLEEKIIHALHRVQNSLDAIDNADDRLHPHPSNIQIQLNKLIDILESNLHNPDSIGISMTQYIELLNEEKNAIAPQIEESHFRNLNEEISTVLNLLQEYQKKYMPSITNNDDPSLNPHISDMVINSSDALGNFVSIAR
jgi:hypothetical protein